ncbi:uncharacterized protein PgNI_08534 [Pyricularia grisea]|uniref:Uncharacterized protein n=1 Tax=Pyricularia grisea TaxID=148305 RepID=A0A6P8AUF5_PYRGI|nr:uncharacterized protein PgNI_08534 [Pyricularia grisea]TLD05830.1 hypothetical protein PgNI_08534 [Pyricularia grisea]
MSLMHPSSTSPANRHFTSKPDPENQARAVSYCSSRVWNILTRNQLYLDHILASTSRPQIILQGSGRVQTGGMAGLAVDAAAGLVYIVDDDLAVETNVYTGID